MDLSEFTLLLADAYEHLYDLVYLRSHPLLPRLVVEGQLTRKEAAWQFHHLLLGIIEELNPGANHPITSREYRHYQLMTLRYVDGLTAHAVAERLAISRRHYYREHEAALDTIAGLMWERRIAPEAGPPSPAAPAPVENAVNRLELLRLEVARVTQKERYGSLPSVLEAVLILLRDKLGQRQITVTTRIDDALPHVAIDKQLLRQLLMAAIGCLLDGMQDAQLDIRVSALANEVQITLEPQPHHGQSLPIEPARERLDSLEEIAQLSSATLRPRSSETHSAGFDLLLPVEPQPTVLIIDDNEDTVALMQRYLNVNHFNVVIVHEAQKALPLAAQLQPVAITLDLMMPDMDGWDLLQLFASQPATQAIPIIVCSVLRQKELALSLGAVAFLEKPVREEALLNILAQLRRHG